MRVATLGLLLLSMPPVEAQSTFFGSYRSRIEAWDWWNGDGDSSYAFNGNTLRFGFTGKKNRWDGMLEAEVPLLTWLPGEAIAPAPQLQLGLGGLYYGSNDRQSVAAMVFAKQAFVRYSTEKQSIQVGRFEFNDGTETTPKNATLASLKSSRISQRLIGSFGWTHVGRSFDGFRYSGSSAKTNVTVVGAFPSRGVFQVDGWGDMRVGFGYAALTRQESWGKSNAADWRVFGIYYQDWRHIVKTDNRSQTARQMDLNNNIRIGSFGGHYLHAAGPVDFLAWGVAQTGRWGALDHRAYAIDFEAGWQIPRIPALKPWIRGGYTQSSGDDDPNDDRHGTFFEILPTPRPYAKFPFYNLMNIEDAFATLALRPHAKVTIAGEIHSLRVRSRADQWVQGGGAFQPWTFGFVGRPANGAKGLATLYDLSVDWRVTPKTTISAYSGYANGKSIIRSIYTSNDAWFSYLELATRW